MTENVIPLQKNEQINITFDKILISRALRDRHCSLLDKHTMFVFSLASSCSKSDIRFTYDSHRTRRFAFINDPTVRTGYYVIFTAKKPPIYLTHISTSKLNKARNCIKKNHLKEETVIGLYLIWGILCCKHVFRGVV